MPTKAKTATSKKSAKQVATEYFAAVAAQDIDSMMSMWEQGKVGHIHGTADLTVPHDYHQWFGALFRAIPDFKFEVLEIVAYGESAAVRWRARGTFNGEGKFEGIAPTGASLDVQGTDVLTIRDGLIRDLHAYMNGMEMARQMGALPPAGSLPEKAMFSALNAKTAAAAAIKRRRAARQ
jgi:predicted ester cyclase